LKTLETKNLELKYTNRNLISTLSEQKDNLKALKAKIIELKSTNVKEHAFEKLNEEHKKLVKDYETLQIKYNKSQEELSQLKELLPEYKEDKGLFGRFLKRKSLDDRDKDVENSVNDKSKKID